MRRGLRRAGWGWAAGADNVSVVGCMHAYKYICTILGLFCTILGLFSAILGLFREREGGGERERERERERCVCERGG